MKPLFFCVVLLLAACQEEVAQDVSAVALTETSAGHYCQMNLLEHDGPKAQIHLAGLPGAPLFFSQVRDAVAYMRMPEQSHAILATWVNDMAAPGASWEHPGADNWLDAEQAFFVVGSTIVGGMGAPEIVPFSTRIAADAFVKTNGGEVMRLADIPDSAALAPVDTPTSAQDQDSDLDFEDRLRALSRQPKG
ncbi:nitrous oxide reductase accessory protein NosL [Pseudorhodobacter sp.]|uniref:nitrous oxide reductase accessory protein NosL n=1 Tax=Pseudorhodobacter sp. TaxID=1934400 RepID=UPI002AFF1C4B|nr:nitrous oxide reductase accessory protein NosL [Pseudorhodobacter sp.]